MPGLCIRRRVQAMRVAIVGTGISGMVAAYLLSREHEVVVYEANDYIGGHTHTVEVESAGRRYAVDTGFIVYNERTYPGFCRLLDQLGVASQPTEMSFSVRCAATGLEYNGHNLNTLFAQRRNLLRPRFYRMLADILRFNREAAARLQRADLPPTLGELLAEGRYGRTFAEHYLVPMGAAIWSSSPSAMAKFPAELFVRFLHNHGLLQVRDRPQWRVIRGGSARYVEQLTAPYRDLIRLRCPVTSVQRGPDGVRVKAQGCEPEHFDRLVLACHSNQALAILGAEATISEREVLCAFRYQPNEAVLHTDTSLLPRRRRAWASWNYHLTGDHARPATLTYNMNILQGLDAEETFCVTLNESERIDPARVLRRIAYSHPVYTPAAAAAQKLHDQLNGTCRTYYCGAYWRFGFHEDGLQSALAVCRHFNQDLEADLLQDLRRTA